jgi:hypothetical protein
MDEFGNFIEPGYGEEIFSVYEKEEYTLVIVRLCTGDGKEAMIFRNSNRITNPPDWLIY